ncbi:RecB family exonuclease [Actinoplanes sp. GCM10030250]|uniref:RecB family exonuclease n=1 Tax=Actinoplanes sp. GCM10030250 TaxID=3273376 RepID=UPI003622B91A
MTAQPASAPQPPAGPAGQVPTGQVPAPRARRPEAPAGPSLSPSRAADFKTCPLLFRFRTIDKLPESPSADQVRGTLVHAVLERLFDLPAAERTPEAAVALVEPEWRRLLDQEPALATLFADPATPPAGPSADAASAAPGDAGLVRDPAAVAAEADATGQQALIDIPGGAEAARIAAFLAGAGNLLTGYFAVEDPQRLQPAERETLISTLIGDELLLRGYIDRLDVSPAGDMRVVDYKTGGAPREAFEGRALFQLKFYALVLWRTRGIVPRVLRLLYLKDAEVCDYSPEAAELERFERTLIALSDAIERAKRDRDFRPKPSRLCGWCSHQALCPEFGGTPPPFPETAPTTPFTPDSEPDSEPDRLSTSRRDATLN